MLLHDNQDRYTCPQGRTLTRRGGHKNKIVHTLVTSTAKDNDAKYAKTLLHGEEETAVGDAAYSSNERSVSGFKGGLLWLTPIKGKKTNRIKKHNKAIAKVRSSVEHVFHTVKCVFGYRKVRYRGLMKNTAQLYSLFMLANLYRVRRQLTG